MKPKLNPLAVLLTGIKGAFWGSFVGALFYEIFSATFFKVDVALQNWMFPHPRDSLGVPWALMILSSIIFGILGLAVAIMNHIRKAKVQKK